MFGEDANGQKIRMLLQKEFQTIVGNSSQLCFALAEQILTALKSGFAVSRATKKNPTQHSVVAGLVQIYTPFQNY